MSRRAAGWALPARSTRASRRPEQLTMTLGMLAERPGSQLDLVAEAGIETIGPRTIVEAPAPTTLF